MDIIVNKKLRTTAEDLEKLLSIRYSAPEYAFLTQVRNQTGYQNHRDGICTADGLALGLFPSRGIYLHGFEIKVYGSDWKKEKANPDKADAIARYCHYWWIVAPDKIVDPDELPMTWGLLVAQGEKLVAKKQPTLMNPEPLTMQILAGIFRKVSESMVPRDMIDELVDDREKMVKKNWENHFKYDIDEASKLKEKVKEFEKISGVDIDGWNLGDVATAVRIINEDAHGRAYDRMRGLKNYAERIVKECDEFFEEKK
jgi:hypothetical protein